MAVTAVPSATIAPTVLDDIGVVIALCGVGTVYQRLYGGYDPQSDPDDYCVQRVRIEVENAMNPRDKTNLTIDADAGRGLRCDVANNVSFVAGEWVNPKERDYTNTKPTDSESAALMDVVDAVFAYGGWLGCVEFETEDDGDTWELVSHAAYQSAEEEHAHGLTKSAIFCGEAV
jgi:hypothetical protein